MKHPDLRKATQPWLLILLPLLILMVVDGHAKPNELFIDPLNRITLTLAPGWHGKAPPQNAAIGVAMITNFVDEPNTNRESLMPATGLKIQIGSGPLATERGAFEAWIEKRVAYETSPAIASDLLTSTEPQTIQLGAFRGQAFLLTGKYHPPVLEIDLPVGSGRVISIGLTPANSPALAEGLEMLASLELVPPEENPPALELESVKLPRELRTAIASLETVAKGGPCELEGNTYPGDEAQDSPIDIWMPFKAGQRWMVGGVGSFYGNWYHCNAYNDYYGTDWNRWDGQPSYGSDVLPVANGTITNYTPTPCPTTGYGCFIQIDHANGVRTLYAHLSAIRRTTGAVDHWESIGAVGCAGNCSGPHLHLSFRHKSGHTFFSHCHNNGNTCPNGEAPRPPQSPKPSPMHAQGGPYDLQDYEVYTSNNQAPSPTPTPPPNHPFNTYLSPVFYNGNFLPLYQVPSGPYPPPSKPYP